MNPTLPETVLRSDGSVVPFEPEVIAQDLFAAMEALGEGNSFLARELTDAVLFFLGQQELSRPTTSELAELVAKVVRELGQPALAEKLLAMRSVPSRRIEASSAEVSGDVPEPFLDAIRDKQSPFELQHLAALHFFEKFSDTEVYPRGLLSAANQGLLTLSDRAAPLELESISIDVKPDTDLLDCLLESRSVASNSVRIFGIESLTISSERAFAELKRVSTITGLRVEVTLNASEESAFRAGEGLFGSMPAEAGTNPDSVAWLRAMKSHSHLLMRYRLDDEITNGESFHHLGQLILDSPNLEIVLNETSDHRAILTTVTMNLASLLEQLGDNPEFDLFLKKLGSLTRLSKSVGYVRRKFLRKYARGGVRSGFLLERARLRVKISGLAEVAQALAGSAGGSPSKCVELQIELLKTIRDALDTDRPGSLDCVIDTVQSFEGDPLTVSQQIRFAAQIQAACGDRGTLWLKPDPDDLWQPETLAATFLKARDAGIASIRLD